DRPAPLVHAHHHGGLTPGVADRLDLLQLVGPGQQVAATLEQLAAEVRAQTIGQHGNMESIDDIADLPYLRLAEKLRLVDKHAMQRSACGDVGLDQGEQILVAGEASRIRLHPDTRSDDPLAEAVVQRRREDERKHAAAAIVVPALQERSALAG